jgi:hypothetical protein
MIDNQPSKLMQMTHRIPRNVKDSSAIAPKLDVTHVAVVKRNATKESRIAKTVSAAISNALAMDRSRPAAPSSRHRETHRFSHLITSSITHNHMTERQVTTALLLTLHDIHNGKVVPGKRRHHHRLTTGITTSLL